MTLKIDFKKTYKNLYTATTTPALVEVPELPFLMKDGVGDPSGPVFAAAVQGLYKASYAIRSALKESVVYPVMPLQGLWRSPAGTDRSDWNWTMMIMQPPQADPAIVTHFKEGTCAQILHIGPFSTEPATVEALHSFIEAQGLRVTGEHHEIYLSSLNRTPQEKMRTIIRYPVG